MTDLWPLIHAERLALADDLDTVTDAQWRTPSLCEGLTVRDVLAHLTVSATLTPLQWMAGVIRCRFDFAKQVQMQLERQLGVSAVETLERFRTSAASTTKPPLPVVGILGEVVVHGEDIRRPLGIAHQYPIDAVTKVVEFYQGSDLLVPGKRTAKGLRLEATDGPFARGSGPIVTGRTLDLAMLLAGRSAYADRIHGPGAITLQERAASIR